MVAQITWDKVTSVETQCSILKKRLDILSERTIHPSPRVMVTRNGLEPIRSNG